MPTRPKTVNCANCNRQRPHCSRGLCGACWKRNMLNGTLNNYARTRNHVAHEDEPDELTGGRWMPVNGIQRFIRDAA